MAWVRIGPAALLPPGAVEEVVIEGTPVAFCNADGEIRALGGTCPHLGGALGHGALDEGLLYCPWHAWEFDVCTGRNPRNPLAAVAVFAVKIEEDAIWVDLPQRA